MQPGDLVVGNLYQLIGPMHGFDAQGQIHMFGSDRDIIMYLGNHQMVGRYPRTDVWIELKFLFRSVSYRHNAQAHHVLDMEELFKMP